MLPVLRSRYRRAQSRLLLFDYSGTLAHKEAVDVYALPPSELLRTQQADTHPKQARPTARMGWASSLGCARAAAPVCVCFEAPDLAYHKGT